jgi:hypothetical protein
MEVKEFTENFFKINNILNDPNDKKVSIRNLSVYISEYFLGFLDAWEIRNKIGILNRSFMKHVLKKVLYNKFGSSVLAFNCGSLKFKKSFEVKDSPKPKIYFSNNTHLYIKRKNFKNPIYYTCFDPETNSINDEQYLLTTHLHEMAIFENSIYLFNYPSEKIEFPNNDFKLKFLDFPEKTQFNNFYKYKNLIFGVTQTDHIYEINIEDNVCKRFEIA